MMNRKLCNCSGGGTATLSQQEWVNADSSCDGLSFAAVVAAPSITWDIYGKQFRQYFRSGRLAAQKKDISVEIVKIEESYLSKDFPSVKEFILNNVEVVPVLLEAPAAVESVFGKSVILSLELQSDPEEMGQELFVKIQNKFSKEEALRLENKLFKEWFSGKIRVVGDKLTICEERYV